MVEKRQASWVPTSAAEILKRAFNLSKRLFKTRRFSFKEFASPRYNFKVKIPTTKFDLPQQSNFIVGQASCLSLENRQTNKKINKKMYPKQAKKDKITHQQINSFLLWQEI